MLDVYIVYNNLFNPLFIKFYKLYLNDLKKYIIIKLFKLNIIVSRKLDTIINHNNCLKAMAL